MRNTANLDLDNRVNNHVYNIRLPLLLSVCLAGGMFLGATLFGTSDSSRIMGTSINKFREVMGIVENEYVDTVNPSQVTDYAISQMLARLDPHSTYIPLKDLELSKASLESDFEGIGIEFLIVNDTVQVISALAGGPSDMVGIMAGDRIISTEGEPIVGPGLSNQEVFSRLRGPQGTRVEVEVVRRGMNKIISFSIPRARISSRSVDAAFMLKPGVGYLKVSRFSDNTYIECQKELAALKRLGARMLLLDLRDNPGGYLDRATKLADEFLPERRLMVYTTGKAKKYDQKYYATASGLFQNDPLLVLVNEGSASASEILAGAIQDNDRGLIVGRRTFGKGLVQVPISLKDGSELRLTISRYYTPSGRCIQKPYKNRLDSYDEELDVRYKNGELFSKDSITIEDTAAYETLIGRKVYGGGGIMPDIFVPLDTLGANQFLIELMGQNLFREFALSYYKKHKLSLDLMKKRVDARSLFLEPTAWQDFVNLSLEKKIKWPYSKQKIDTEQYISHLLKAYVARLIWGDTGFYMVISQKDPMIISALRQANRAQKLLLASKNKTPY